MTDHSSIIKSVSTWLSEYAVNNGRSCFVVNFSGSRADALALKCCIEATTVTGGLSVRAVSFNDRKAFSILHSIYKNAEFIWTADPKMSFVLLGNSDNSPVLVGSQTWPYGAFYRAYKKFEEGICDIFPIFDIPQSIVIDITNSLWPGTEWINDLSLDSVLQDEFAARTEEKHGLILSDSLPSSHQRWPFFTTAQKQSVAFLHQREKKTRHKSISHKPFPKIQPC